MAELAMGADLPVETPAVALQNADDISYLHELRVRERCDDLREPSPLLRDRRSRISRPGRQRRAKLLVKPLAHPALHNTNTNSLVDGPTLQLATAHSKVRRDGYFRQRP
jgi:hypothetical protein